MMEHEIIVCECESVEHQIIFAYFPEYEDDREVYMSIYLHPTYGFFRRLWAAIKYIFGHRSIYGHFDDVIISQKDSHKLVKILKYLDPDVFKNCAQESKDDLRRSTTK